MKMPNKIKSIAWAILYLDSLRADLRLAGKFAEAGKIREQLESLGQDVGDISLSKLREFRDGYRKHRNKPNASLVELEMF